jgi:hypothetical protein
MKPSVQTLHTEAVALGEQPVQVQVVAVIILARMVMESNLKYI